MGRKKNEDLAAFYEREAARAPDWEEPRQIYCIWTYPGGRRCRAFAQKGKEVCYWHDPDRTEERDTGLRTEVRPGGPQRILPATPRLETVEDVRLLLGQVAAYLATAPRPELGRAEALAAVGSRFLRALDVARLQHELEAARAEIKRLRAQLADEAPGRDGDSAIESCGQL